MTHPKVGLESVQKTLGDLEGGKIGVIPSGDTLGGMDRVASLDGRKGGKDALRKKGKARKISRASSLESGKMDKQIWKVGFREEIERP